MSQRAVERMELADDVVSIYEFKQQYGSGGIYQNPYLRLMFWMLDDAVRIYLREKCNYHASVSEAEGWIFDDNDELFGFVNVCEMLGIEPHALRKRLNMRLMRQNAGETVERIVRAPGSHRTERLSHKTSRSGSRARSMYPAAAPAN